MRLFLRARLSRLLYGCVLCIYPEKGKTAKMLGAAGKGSWKCCAICHALCVLDAFEAKHVRRAAL